MKISDQELKEMISRMEWKQDLLGIWKPVDYPVSFDLIEIPHQSWIPGENQESIHRFKVLHPDYVHCVGN